MRSVAQVTRSVPPRSGRVVAIEGGVAVIEINMFGRTAQVRRNLAEIAVHADEQS